MPSEPLPLTRESVQKAHEIIKPLIHRTPLLTSSSLSDALDSNATLLFKAENLQKAGAFKFRGASYNLSCLSQEELEKGVVTHSSGNHAGALALAAKLQKSDVPCHLVMPRDSAPPKIRASQAYGAHITFCEPNAAARTAKMEEIQKATGAIFIPPYDSVNTMLGQGTCLLEMEEQSVEDGHGKLSCMVAPVGGGGLLGGCSISAKGTGIRVFGAEPEMADDAARGLARGERISEVHPNTIADGLRTPVGMLNFPVIKENVEQIFTVSEQEIIDAQKLLWERLKMVVEPSGAVAYAAVRSEAFKALGIQGPVGIILSGGNIDLDKPLPWM